MKQGHSNILKSVSASRFSRDRHLFARRMTLFLSMLLSGGLLVFPRIPILIIVIVLGLMAIGFRVASLRKTWPIILVLFGILVITGIRSGPIHLESLVVRYANFLCALVLLNIYLIRGWAVLGKDLHVILRWMAFQAILTTVLANTLGDLFTTVRTADADFQTLLLVFNYHSFIEDASGLLRPDGFFYEPGVYQIYLNIYLYLTLFVFKNTKQTILAILAVFVTQSTTGILIAVILLGAAFISQLALGGLRKKLIIFLFAVVIGPPIAYIGYSNVTDKLTGEAQGSSWAREYDFFTGINVIAEHPLLGVGFDHQRYLAISQRLGYADTLLTSQDLEDRATSNGLIYLFYSVGIPMALVFVYGMFRQSIFKHRLLIGLLLFLSMFGEALIYTPFILMIIFSAFISSKFSPSKQRNIGVAPV